MTPSLRCEPFRRSSCALSSPYFHARVYKRIMGGRRTHGSKGASCLCFRSVSVYGNRGATSLRNPLRLDRKSAGLCRFEITPGRRRAVRSVHSPCSMMDGGKTLTLPLPVASTCILLVRAAGPDTASTRSYQSSSSDTTRVEECGGAICFLRRRFKPLSGWQTTFHWSADQLIRSQGGKSGASC